VHGREKTDSQCQSVVQNGCVKPSGIRRGLVLEGLLPECVVVTMPSDEHENATVARASRSKSSRINQQL
jgi:hypothetical protein